MKKEKKIFVAYDGRRTTFAKDGRRLTRVKLANGKPDPAVVVSLRMHPATLAYFDAVAARDKCGRTFAILRPHMAGIYSFEKKGKL